MPSLRAPLNTAFKWKFKAIPHQSSSRLSNTFQRTAGRGLLLQTKALLKSANDFPPDLSSCRSLEYIKQVSPPSLSRGPRNALEKHESRLRLRFLPCFASPVCSDGELLLEDAFWHSAHKTSSSPALTGGGQKANPFKINQRFGCIVPFVKTTVWVYGI